MAGSPSARFADSLLPSIRKVGAVFSTGQPFAEVEPFHVVLPVAGAARAAAGKAKAPEAARAMPRMPRRLSSGVFIVPAFSSTGFCPLDECDDEENQTGHGEDSKNNQGRIDPRWNHIVIRIALVV